MENNEKRVETKKKDTKEVILYDYSENYFINQSIFSEVSKQSLIDQLSFDEVANILSEDIEESPEHFLTFWATFIRIGNLVYLESDGSIRIDNRDEQDVIDSLLSFEKKPFLLEHPKDSILVDSSNSRKYVRGLTHIDPIYDRGLGRIRVTVTDKEAIEAIKSTHTQISPGLTASVIKDAGDWHGSPYTHKQKNLRGNHLAGVVSGRAGRLVAPHIRINDAENFSVEVDKNIIFGFDGQPQIVSSPNDSKDSEITKHNEINQEVAMETNKAKDNGLSPGREISQTKINFDGIDFAVSETAAIAIHQKISALEKEIAEKTAEIQTLKEVAESADSIKAVFEADLASATEQNSELQTQIEALQDSLKPENLEKMIQARIKPRVELETVARKVIGDSTDFSDKDDKAVKVDVVNKIYNEEIVSLKDSAEEIEGAFRVAVRQFEKTSATNVKNNSDQSRAAVFDANNYKPGSSSNGTRQFQDAYILDEDEQIYNQHVEKLKSNASAPLSANLSKMK